MNGLGRPGRTATLLLALVLAFGFLVYQPGLSGSFQLDDWVNLGPLATLDADATPQTYLQFLVQGIASPLGRPLSLATFMAQAPDWPDNPAAFIPVNLLLHHGVRACLEYGRSGDPERARAASNPDLAPHLSFLDMGGHGYATLRVAGDAAECEFVCIPRPLERSESPDGGPLRYRVVHRAPLWRAGERPSLERRVLEGDPGLAL